MAKVVIRRWVMAKAVEQGVLFDTSSLHPEKRVDKKGKVVKRWIKNQEPAKVEQGNMFEMEPPKRQHKLIVEKNDKPYEATYSGYKQIRMGSVRTSAKDWGGVDIEVEGSPNYEDGKRTPPKASDAKWGAKIKFSGFAKGSRMSSNREIYSVNGVTKKEAMAKAKDMLERPHDWIPKVAEHLAKEDPDAHKWFEDSLGSLEFEKPKEAKEEKSTPKPKLSKKLTKPRQKTRTAVFQFSGIPTGEMLRNAALGWGNISKLADIDLLKAYKYASAAKHMKEHGINTSDGTWEGKNVLEQVSDSDLLDSLTKEVKKRKLDKVFKFKGLHAGDTDAGSLTDAMSKWGISHSDWYTSRHKAKVALLAEAENSPNRQELLKKHDKMDSDYSKDARAHQLAHPDYLALIQHPDF